MPNVEWASVGVQVASFGVRWNGVETYDHIQVCVCRRNDYIRDCNSFRFRNKMVVVCDVLGVGAASFPREAKWKYTYICWNMYT